MHSCLAAISGPSHHEGRPDWVEYIGHQAAKNQPFDGGRATVDSSPKSNTLTGNGVGQAMTASRCASRKRQLCRGSEPRLRDFSLSSATGF